MISFVMLTWNRKEFVSLCLNSFFENISRKYEFEFLIIDNGSTDGTVELLKQNENQHGELKIIYNDSNKGLEEYKKLFKLAKGKYVIELDDDVIEFPQNFDSIMVDYMNTFKKIGALSLDVIQNEFTNGAKPGPESYTEKCIDNKVIQVGPCGGWCMIFRKWEYNLVKLFFSHKSLNMKNGEDGCLTHYLKKILRKPSGVIKDVKCFHACGPYYSKKYNYTNRDIEKYRQAGLIDFVEKYSK